MDVAISADWRFRLQNETIQESPDDEFISLLNNASPIPHFMKEGWIKKWAVSQRPAIALSSRWALPQAR